MRLLKPHNRRSLSSLSSPSDALLADKAITYLKRHPHHLDSLSSQFTPEAASNLLLKSQFDQPITLKFLNWARRHQFLTFQCKCLALHILTRFKLYKSAQSLAEDVALNAIDDTGALVFQYLKDSYHVCNSSSAVFDLVVKSYSHVNLIDKAMNIVNLAKAHGFMPGVLSYNAILDAVLRSTHSLKLAEDVFSEMTRNGVSPNVYTYNVLIRGFCGEGNLEMGFHLKRQMEKYGCLPNVVTYNTLLDAYCKHRRMDEAFKLLKSMKIEGVEANLISYNVVINGLCREGRIRETEQVLEEMNRKGFAPDEVTYNTLVNGFCKEGNFHQALVLHAEMVRKGLSPNVVTYTTLINSMCKAKNLNRAVEFLDQMRVRGLSPNGRTYTTLIDGFCQQGLLNEAYNVLNEMIVCGFPPSIITYNALVNGHCLLGRVEDALGILRNMVEKGISPDVVSYSTIISGFCRSQELEKAFQMKLEMVEKGISPDAVTYSSLIHGLCQRSKLIEACNLFEEMLHKGVPPDEFSYTTLINAHCVEGELSKALKLHNEMIQKGFLPDAVTYSVLINGLNKLARTREAKKLLLKLFYDESIPDDVTYNTLIENCSNIEFKSVAALVKGFCMKGLMNEADRVFETMLQRNHKPNEAVYNVLIHGHCRCANVKKAYNLYQEMVHSGFDPHTVTVLALLKALFRKGMITEMSQVIQHTLRSCRLTDAELAKVLIEINYKEGNMDAVLNILTEMAKDGLLPNSGNHSYPAARLGVEALELLVSSSTIIADHLLAQLFFKWKAGLQDNEKSPDSGSSMNSLEGHQPELASSFPQRNKTISHYPAPLVEAHPHQAPSTALALVPSQSDTNYAAHSKQQWRAHAIWRKGCQQKWQQWITPVSNNVRTNRVSPDIDDLVPHDVAGGEPVVQKTIPEMGGIVGTTRGLHTHVPEDLLVISHNLKENRRIPISASIACGDFLVVRKAMKLHWACVNRSTHVRKRSELFKRLRRFN
ncbi:pentatricopeptide repeat-containing protein [Senna tora]|uniref:Pentatricopeptide repeat-containing protein n=1 Tax=Senna tora TaxID=362788 RepID=A0A834XAL2_9FABA|nr:pentatricopeptide repeat-containing protein [Senna tora]